MTTHTDTLDPRRCHRGHPLTSDNLTPGGKCRACNRIRSASARRNKRLIRELQRKEDRDIAAGKIDYLYLTPVQQAASDQLNEAIDRHDVAGGLRCMKPNVSFNEELGRLVEVYPHTDYDERTPPSVVEAARMCRGCPVINECLAFARTIHPASGVFGGTTFVDGVPQDR